MKGQSVQDASARRRQFEALADQPDNVLLQFKTREDADRFFKHACDAVRHIAADACYFEGVGKALTAGLLLESCIAIYGAPHASRSSSVSEN